MFDAAMFPALLDTTSRSAVETALAAASQTDDRATLHYARGYLAAQRGEVGSSVASFAAAQVKVDRGDAALAARIALELGYLYVTQGAQEAARAIAAWGEGLAGADAADIAHLRALLANSAGDYVQARSEYRVAIAHAPAAVSPFTYAIALTNLAVALSHRDPAGSAELARLSLRTMAAARLHPAIAPAAQNALGYAYICLGEFRAASDELADARDAAIRTGNATIAQFAEYNLAIVDELHGDIAESRSRLEHLRDIEPQPARREFQHWVELRLAWLAARAGDATLARMRLEPLRRSVRSADFENAALQLDAVIAVSGHRLGEAREILRGQIARWTSNGDDLNVFVAGLWLAHVETLSGRSRAARIALGAAVEVGMTRRFRVSPNWWIPAIVDSAREGAVGDIAAYLQSLWVVRSCEDSRSIVPEVQLCRDGMALVNGTSLGTEPWRVGRAGPNVLRRLFATLIDAHPGFVLRDDLADLLWPDSDGDHARTNLYAATRDLRRVLAALPGVAVIVTDGRYSLRLAANVNVVPQGALKP